MGRPPTSVILAPRRGRPVLSSRPCPLLRAGHEHAGRRAVLNPYAGLEGALAIPLQRLLVGAFFYGRQEVYAEAVDVEADPRGCQISDLAGAVRTELKVCRVEVRHLPQVACGAGDAHGGGRPVLVGADAFHGLALFVRVVPLGNEGHRRRHRTSTGTVKRQSSVRPSGHTRHTSKGASYLYASLTYAGGLRRDVIRGVAVADEPLVAVADELGEGTDAKSALY